MIPIKNGAVASGHGFSTVFILQIAAKQEKNELANSRFGFSFFIVAFFLSLSLFFGAGGKALQNPTLPPLPVYSKRCLRHVPIKVVRNFAAPGKQCLSKHIVGLAEAVYLRGIHIHMHMHIHVHIHIYLYLYLYLSVYIDLYISIHVIIPSSEPRFRLFSLQHFFIRRFCRGKRKAGKHTHGIRAGADWLLDTDTRRTHMMLEGLVNNTNTCNQTRT